MKLNARFLHLAYMVYLQGGAMNRGLLVAGPPPPPLGGCERKD
jgi:hypothetical protein